MQRLVARADTFRFEVGRQRLHAFTPQRQHQTLAVSNQPSVAIAVPECLAEEFQVLIERRFPDHRFLMPCLKKFL
uniref:Uncharacterized protein n=1 Tax=Paraburkholderia sprentiae WSM5005 TaxID=754502 RepID=A0A1I9YLJ9_9BURK